MMMGSSTRQRQLKVTFGAGEPLAFHAKTLISRSVPLFKREWVIVRKHALEVNGVATTLIGCVSLNSLRQRKLVSRNTLWPLVVVVAKPLTSNILLP
jgi:hypothetical protein